MYVRSRLARLDAGTGRGTSLGLGGGRPGTGDAGTRDGIARFLGVSFGRASLQTILILVFSMEVPVPDEEGFGYLPSCEGPSIGCQVCCQWRCFSLT